MIMNTIFEDLTNEQLENLAIGILSKNVYYENIIELAE